MAKICVIGTGYVGLVTGTCFAEMGNRVTCLDINQNRVEKLSRSIVPFFEPGLEEFLVRNTLKQQLFFTTNYPDALKDAEFIFICVGTPPSPDGSTDLSQWNSSVEQIINYVDHPVVIINKSTLPVGTGLHLLNLLNSSNKNPKATFAVVSNPEFLREGSAIKDSMQPDRVIIGSNDPTALEKVAALYSVLNSPIVKSSLNTAELTKYASNAYLATRISFINEIANICEVIDADIDAVVEGMGLDKRIGSRYLSPGIGWGGSCFPKDIKSLKHSAQSHGISPQLLQAVEDVNYRQRKLIISKLKKELKELKGKTIAILGLAFKPNTDDVRDAPALDIITSLQDEGAVIKAFDPQAMQLAKTKLTDVEMCNDAYSAAKGAHALVLVTEWKEFQDLDFSVLQQAMAGNLIIDGRNLFDRQRVTEAGFVYVGMGRNS